MNHWPRILRVTSHRHALKTISAIGTLVAVIQLLKYLMTPSVVQLLLAIVLIISAIYMMSRLSNLSADSFGWRKLLKGLGVVMLTYGILMLIGAASNSGNVLHPLRGVITIGACS